MSAYRFGLVFHTTLMTILSLPAAGQWLNYPTPGVPMTKDGRPNLKAPTPRTAQGKPDFSGLWDPIDTMKRPDPSNPYVHNGVGIDIANGMKDAVPYQPWAAELVRKRKADFQKDHPDAKCLPLSPVELDAHPTPRRIVQIPGMLLILHERFTNFRTIFTDGRPLPVDPQPSWQGYSTAKWDGDTLVVETNGLKDDTYLDYSGSPMTSAGKMTERFTRADYGSLQIEITVDDPKAYTKPWTIPVQYRIMLNTDLLEGFCDNEKDQAHLVGK